MRWLLIPVFLIPSCGRIADVGRAPEFSPTDDSGEYYSLYSSTLPISAQVDEPGEAASLWTAAQSSLLGDRRAGSPGDILTVVIEIDDRAEMSNQSGRERSGSENMAVPDLFGLPQRIDLNLPEGASMDPAVQTSSASSYDGSGSVRRKEKLMLRIAATVMERLPNDVLRIEGQQEVRVNFELRELVVKGFVRSADISRQNEITYDKMAGAQISYGGRGQITDVQQPRYGQQVSDILLPF